MIDWDVYFMGLAWLIKERSPDPDTKHGAVIVDYNNRIVGTGYNGHPSHTTLPEKYFKRPDKYKCMIHAEHNAILNANIKESSKMYTTGRICLNCLMYIKQSRIDYVVQLQRRGTALEEDLELYDEIKKQSGIEFKWMSIDCLNKFNQVFDSQELKKIQTCT